MSINNYAVVSSILTYWATNTMFPLIWNPHYFHTAPIVLCCACIGVV